MSVVIGIMITAAMIMLYRGVRYVRTPGYDEQLAPYGSLEELLPQTRYARLVRPWALRFRHFGLLRAYSDPTKLAQQLDYAGNPQGITADEFYGIQVSGLVLGLLLGLLPLISGAVLPLLLFPLIGFIYPRFWLRGKVRRRQAAITIALPDLLDMLAVCVSAGMGFDVALILLVERGEGPLYEEMARLLRQLRIGEPREMAFRNVINRNSSDQLRGFMDALLQSDELGTPISDTLERQAEDMRLSRRHRARAAGAKASTKISLVVVSLVVPPLLCVILSGIVLMVMQTSGAITGPGQRQEEQQAPPSGAFPTAVPLEPVEE